MSFRYVPSEHRARENVGLYTEMTEHMSIETPSYHFSMLLTNFGGTLGLMTGMSVISVAELSIWFVLFLIDRGNRLKKRVKNRYKFCEQDSNFVN